MGNSVCQPREFLKTRPCLIVYDLVDFLKGQLMTNLSTKYPEESIKLSS